MKRIMLFLLVSFLFCWTVEVGFSKGFSSGSSGGSRSYSSGSSSRSYSSGSSSRSYSSGTSKSSSGSTFSKKYSSGSNSSNDVKTPARSFDSKAASAAKIDHSRSTYRAKYYTPPLSEPKVQQEKQRTFYNVYYSRPQVVREVHYYNDSFNPFFMLWLLDRSANDRALWAYHHRDQMDNERYKELLAKDADLEKHIKDLEAQGIKKDPNYKPQGVDDDLMYNSKDDQDKTIAIAADADEDTSLWKTIGLSIIGILSLGLVIWFFVFKKIY